jgi:prolyl 4-hydroxylase
MDTVLNPTSPPAIFSDDVKVVPGFLRGIPNVLSSEECQAIIDLCENKGFSPASFYTDKDGVEHYSDIRKSQRLLIDSAPFTQTLWNRIQHHVPTQWNTDEEVIGLNERLRILKYLPGDEFKPHVDGNYISPEGQLSRLTLLVYLNEGYEGGFTHYYTHDGLWIGIPPQSGMVVLQDQNLYHTVPPLEKGCKYAIRTDVMARIPHNPAHDKVIRLTNADS